MSRIPDYPSGDEDSDGDQTTASTFHLTENSWPVYTIPPVTQVFVQLTDALRSNIQVNHADHGFHPTISQISPTTNLKFSELSQSGFQSSTKATPWLSLSDDGISNTCVLSPLKSGASVISHQSDCSTKLNDQTVLLQTATGGKVTLSNQSSAIEGVTATGNNLNITESSRFSVYTASTKIPSATYSTLVIDPNNIPDHRRISFVDARQAENSIPSEFQLASDTQLYITRFDLGIIRSLPEQDRVAHKISTTPFSKLIGCKNSWHDLSLSSDTHDNPGHHLSSVDLTIDRNHLGFNDVLDDIISSSSTSSQTAKRYQLLENSYSQIKTVITDIQSVISECSSLNLDVWTRIESLSTRETTIKASRLLTYTVTPSVTPSVTQIEGRRDILSNDLQASFTPASVTPINSYHRHHQTRPPAAPMGDPLVNPTETSTQPGPPSHQPATDVMTHTTFGLTTNHVAQSSAVTSSMSSMMSSMSLAAVVTTSPLSTTPVTGPISASTEITVIIVAACSVFALLLLVLVAVVCVRKTRKKMTKVQQEGDELWVDMNHIHSMPLPSLTSTNELTLNLKSGTDTYTVSCPFTALDGGQINLNEGDILQIDERQDDWWKGLNLNTGQTGWFPCDFVRPLGGSKENIPWENKLKSSVEMFATNVHPLRAQRQVSSFQIKQNMTAEVNRNREMVLPELEDHQEVQYVESWVKMAASVSMSSLPTTERSYTNTSDYNAAVKDGKTFRAVYAYKPVFKGEMALKEGEIVVCKERDRNGWMFGMKPRSKDEGWFPAIYVDEISTDSESFNSDIPETYEILDSNKLHKADHSWIGIEHKAMYDYASCIPGDLNLEENDVIIVLQTMANGWWFGLKGDNYGWFPGSYVELIEENDTDIADSSSIKTDVMDSLAQKGGNSLDRQNNVKKTNGNDQITDSTKLSPLKPSSNPLQLMTKNEQKSEHNFRPNRKAPKAPGSAAEVPVLKPARPAPAPPVRQHSQLRKESLFSDSYQMNKLDSEVTPLTKQALAFQGKRPKLTKVARGLISDKQLNPIIRPSTRGFVPRPLQSNPYQKNDQFNFNSKLEGKNPKEEFHQHDIFLKDMDRLSNGRLSFSSQGSLSPSYGHLGQVHGSDPDNDHASNFSHERSQTSDARLERSNSPIIPTSGHFLHNVQRFNRFIRHTSPTLSDSSDCVTKFTKSSVRERNTQLGNDKLLLHKTVSHKKIPPPVVPHSKPRLHLKKGVESPSETNSELNYPPETSSNSNYPSDTNRENNDIISTGVVTSANDVITSEVHGVVPITPGKVSEIVQQINKLAPLQQNHLNRTDSDSDTITNMD